MVSGAGPPAGAAAPVEIGTPHELQKRAPESARSAPHAAQFSNGISMMSTGGTHTLTNMTAGSLGPRSLTQQVQRARVPFVRRSTDRGVERGEREDVPGYAAQ